MFNSLMSSYWEVCTLKRSPEDTPYSPLLLFAFSFFYFILIQFQWHFQALPPQFRVVAPLATGFFLVCANVLFMGVLLKAVKKSNRFVQSTTALMAVHSILHVFLLPFIVLMGQYTQFADPGSAPMDASGANIIFMVLLGVLSLVISIWQLVAIIFVMRKTLAVDQLSAVLATFALLVFSNLCASYLGSIL